MNLIQELLQLNEGAGDEAHLKQTMRRMPGLLPHEARFKEWEYDMQDKKVWWVTQEETDYDYVADEISQELADEGFIGWTVHVAVRDDWSGGYRDNSAPWVKNVSAQDPHAAKPQWWIVSDGNSIEEGGWDNKADAQERLDDHYHYDDSAEVAYGIEKRDRELRRLPEPSSSEDKAKEQPGEKGYVPDKFVGNDDMMKAIRDFS